MLKRRSILTFTIFMVPFGLFSFFPLGVLYVSGELVPVKDRIARQQNSASEMLLSKSYFVEEEDLRRETFLYVRPQVTMLGNSRVYPIRQEFFNDDVTFYNTADFGVGIGHAFSEFWPLLEGGKEPEVVMVGLEQNLFSKNSSLFAPSLSDGVA